TLQSDEQRRAGRRQRAGIGRDRIDLAVHPVQATTGHAGDVGQLQRPHARASIAARATSVSSNGWRTPSISWYGSWPLPAISTMASGPAMASAGGIGVARGRSTVHAR